LGLVCGVLAVEISSGSNLGDQPDEFPLIFVNSKLEFVTKLTRYT